MKLILESSSGAYLVGVAKKKLAQLRDMREKTGAAFLSKIILVTDGHRIDMQVYTDSILDKIRIFGGGFPEILFCAPDGVLTAYSYTNDVLTPVGSVEVYDVLHPTFNGESHVGELASATFGTRWGTATLDAAFTHLANDQVRELEVLVRGGILAGRVADQVGDLVNREDVAGTWMDTYAQAMGNGPLVYLPLKRAGMWNLINGPEFWVLNPATRALFASSWWVPNILNAESGNGSMVPGFYYGALGSSWREPGGASGGPGNPSDSVKVTFNALLDNRKTGAKLPYGYAETLVSMDEEVFNEIFFYLSATPPADYGNPTILHQGLTYGRDCGTIMHGKEWTFSITPEFVLPLYEDFTVSLWNTADDRVEGDFTAFTNDFVGVVISNGLNAEVYLWTGATYKLFTTAAYHSHSYSTDGRILAIFEQENGVINRVVVLDLNNRAVVDDPESAFIPGTPLQDSVTPATLGATTGCVIPFRAESAVPTELGYDLAASVAGAAEDDPVQLKHVAHFGTIQYNKLFPAGLGFKKIVCADGIHAEVVHTDDICMRGNVTIVDIALGQDEGPGGSFTFTVEEETFTGSWSEVLAQLPYVLWSAPGWPYEVALAKWEDIDGLGPVAKPISVEATGTEHTPSIGEIPVPTLSLHADAYGGYSASGALGGYEISVHDPPDLSDSCPGEYTWPVASVTDSCNRSAEIEDETTITCAVSFSKSGTPGVLAVGDVFTGSGGKAPYSFSLGAGSISSSGVVTSLPSCPSTVNKTTFTGSDSCGCESSDEFRINYGGRVWVYAGEFLFAGASSDSCCMGGFPGVACPGYPDSCCGGSIYCGGYPAPVCTISNYEVSPTQKMNVVVGSACGSHCICGSWYASCRSPVEKAAPAGYEDVCWPRSVCTLGPSSSVCQYWTSKETRYEWECPP